MDARYRIESYARFAGEEVIERIKTKARRLADAHVVHVNSTYYGGGVAVILDSLTLLMNNLGIRTGWRNITGRGDFFSITKKFHNALQGGECNLSRLKLDIYEEVNAQNALRTHLQHDFVVVHDPQPLPLILNYQKRQPWIWHCHIDLSQPYPPLWNYLRPMIERYDAVVLSMQDYQQELSVPQRIFAPAIDPLITKNTELSAAEIDDRFRHYGIPTDLPIVAQISRFDRWKDPEGVIRAVNLARGQVECTLVLLGNVATDDPEGQEVYESLLGYQDERTLIISAQDTALVNALQTRSAVVLQKSLREGFGLTVSEALWKGTPVIGANAGGIPLQIEDGVNGFLVDSVEEAAERLVQLLKNPALGKRMGAKARETVKNRFLMHRLVEDYLDLLNGFETVYRLR